MNIEGIEHMLLTIIDLRDGISGTRHRRWCCVEALQPVTHSRLGISIVPQDVDSGCIKDVEMSVEESTEDIV